MLYKYCNSDGFDILLHSRLKVTRVSEFNDPFDLAFGMDDETAFERIKAEFEEDPKLIEKWSIELTKLGWSHNKNSIKNMAAKVSEFLIEGQENAIKSTKEFFNNMFGITCMSERPDIIQMWSHYANAHKGIVIGLEENEFVGDRAKLVKVTNGKDMVLFPYTASIPMMSKQVMKEYEKGFKDVLGRKESGWCYEEEVRVFEELEEQDKDGNYYVKIPPSSVREIYLGLRSPETSEIIARALKQKKEFRHLKIFRMEKSTKEYKLIPRLLNVQNMP